MPAVIGIALAVSVALMARLIGFDRDRAFYPLVVIVIASYYELFAVMGGDRFALVEETIAFALFATAAVIGFRTSLWIVVAALAAHGIFDFFHQGIISNGGVPIWWRDFCLSFDVAAAGCMAMLLRLGVVPVRPSAHPASQ